MIHTGAKVDREGPGRLGERCRAALAAGTTTVVIDFTGLADCCSAVFLTLLQLDDLCRAGRTQLHLVGLDAALRRCRRRRRVGGGA